MIFSFSVPQQIVREAWEVHCRNRLRRFFSSLHGYKLRFSFSFTRPCFVPFVACSFFSFINWIEYLPIIHLLVSHIVMLSVPGVYEWNLCFWEFGLLICEIVLVLGSIVVDDVVVFRLSILNHGENKEFCFCDGRRWHKNVGMQLWFSVFSSRSR